MADQEILTEPKKEIKAGVQSNRLERGALREISSRNGASKLSRPGRLTELAPVASLGHFTQLTGQMPKSGLQVEVWLNSRMTRVAERQRRTIGGIVACLTPEGLPRLFRAPDCLPRR